MAKKYSGGKKAQAPVNLSKLQPDQLEAHLGEKFTQVAVAFRRQVSQLFSPDTCMPECLKRMNVEQMLEVQAFLIGPAVWHLDKDKIEFIGEQGLALRMAAAQEAFQADCLVTAERWRLKYFEDESVTIEDPGWFALMRGNGNEGKR